MLLPRHAHLGRGLRTLPFALMLLQACATEVRVDDENTAPSAPIVSIGPVSPRTDDDLVAVIDTPSVDEESDVVAYAYTWKQDGLPRGDLTSETVPASETSKGEVWEVTVTPTDGEIDGPAASSSATILNTAPEVTVALSPAAPGTDDDLEAVPVATDADGDPVSFSFAWALDSAPQSDVSDTIPAERTERGQRWSVTVTPSDDEEAGTPATSEVEIGDSAPVALAVSLVPEQPYVTDDVVAVAEAADADGDAVDYRYTWYVDGTAIQSGASDTLPAGSARKQQRVSVEVVPNDGVVDGDAILSADATVLNSLPTAGGVTIDPSVAYETSTLTCAPWGFADADGDPEGWTYAWTVGGGAVATGPTLDGSSFAKGDTVTCAATPWDGEAAGEPVVSAALTVSNSAPTLASADLSTYTPTENDTLSVSLGAVTDVDGDTVSFDYTWYVNGSAASTGSTLLANRFAKGDSIYVVVTPWDGRESGPSVTSPVATGSNTPPSVASVSLSPTAAYTNDTITATITAADLDGDALSYTYDWYVDGVSRGSPTSSTLSGSTYFNKGQTVYVVVTADDGDDLSAPLASSSVTVLNTAPTAPTVEVTPASPERGDDLTCSVVTTSSDADGDALTYVFAWDVDGASYAGATDWATSSVVNGGDVDAAETWTCEVYADDGSASSSVRDASVETAGCDLDADGSESPLCGGSDCDDGDPAVHPGAAELCDATDEDCDGLLDSEAACGCHTATYGDDSYIFCDASSGKTYASAATWCSARGYGMVEVNDVAENNWIVSEGVTYGLASPSTTGQNGLYIGINDSLSEGTFAWPSGASTAFTNWYSGAVNTSAYDCAEVYIDYPGRPVGVWNILSCSSTYGYICETGG